MSKTDKSSPTGLTSAEVLARRQQFGEDYRTYIRKSKKLIPGIW